MTAPQFRGLGRQSFAVAGLAFDGVPPFFGPPNPKDILSTVRCPSIDVAGAVAERFLPVTCAGPSGSASFPFVAPVLPGTFATCAALGPCQGREHGFSSGATRRASSIDHISICAGF